MTTLRSWPLPFLLTLLACACQPPNPDFCTPTPYVPRWTTVTCRLLRPDGGAAQADAQIGLKNYAAAERSLKQALQIAPNLVAAQRSLLGLLVADGRYPEALALAREVQKQRPAEAVGHQFEGDIEMQRRNWEAGLAAHRMAMQKSRTAESAIRLHGALLAAGKAEEAQRLAAGWQKDNPQDPAFPFYLGDTALAQKDWAQAEARYREVLRTRPDHARHSTTWPG